MQQPDRYGPVARIILWSVENRWLVIIAVLLLAIVTFGVARRTQVDALPDLGDVQVVVHTSYPGQAPQIVEDQVTFPLTSALIAVPAATAVRGYSSFGDSFIYVLFADGTDPYWARDRVFEYLNRAQASLPAGARTALGPDATGLGWAYEYALVDRSGRHDIAQLRSLQDWWLRYELQAVAGVAEVATLGGKVREYQVVLDPLRLKALRIPLAGVRSAIEAGNAEAGGSVIEMAEAEYMVRASGYVKRLEDLRRIPIGVNDAGRPITLGDVADVRYGPQERRGVADLDGEGEVVGGVVIVRQGANVREVIGALKMRMAALRKSLPAGVEIVPTYDRSGLIDRTIRSLGYKLVVEFAVVLLVCLLFLYHIRSALVVIAVVPLGVVASLCLTHLQGLTANVMSLGGIAVAIGAMVDAAIVMVENVHKRLEKEAAAGVNLDAGGRLAVIAAACIEVGPALLCSLLVIALSFLPVLALQGQELRLFAPLAYTKTYAMLAAASLSIVAVPALIALIVSGRTRAQRETVANRAAEAVYRPALSWSLRHPGTVVVVAALLVLSSVWPLIHLGGEFMPEMDEGDLLYMPTTLPGIGIGPAGDLLQRTDQLIRTVPEVERVFGKAGRVESATDPAPLEMLETLVQLKPRELWRPGMTLPRLRAELDARVKLPGLTNSWLAPIRTRIDMLTSGVRTPLALTISGPDLQQIERLGERLERILKAVPGAESVYAERVASGRYIDLDVDRASAARYGLNIADVHQIVSLAIGGQSVGETVEGRERYPITLRYPQSWRDSPEALRALPIVTGQGAQITLGDVAAVRITNGPARIGSEGGRPTAWVNIVLGDRDPQSFVEEARVRIDAAGIPPGYSVRWTGQYEYMRRAFDRLEIVIPCTLVVIVLLLYLTFRRLTDVALVLAALPLCLVGGYWLMWLLGYRQSVATTIGFIALAGVATETGIVMLIYLNNAWRARLQQQTRPSLIDLREAITDGALLRLRPKLMTVLAIIAGLLPIMLGGGAGSEVMRRIAAPMVGGMVTATVLTLLVVPALFLLVHRRRLEPSR